VSTHADVGGQIEGICFRVKKKRFFFLSIKTKTMFDEIKKTRI
jgi:hypothetical protein